MPGTTTVRELPHHYTFAATPPFPRQPPFRHFSLLYRIRRAHQQKPRNPPAGSLAKIPLRGPGTRYAGWKKSHAGSIETWKKYAPEPVGKRGNTQQDTSSDYCLLYAQPIGAPPRTNNLRFAQAPTHTMIRCEILLQELYR